MQIDCLIWSKNKNKVFCSFCAAVICFYQSELPSFAEKKDTIRLLKEKTKLLLLAKAGTSCTSSQRGWSVFYRFASSVGCKAQRRETELNSKKYFDIEKYHHKKMNIFLAMVSLSSLVNVLCEHIKQEIFHWQPVGSSFSGLAQEFTGTNSGRRFVMRCTTRWVYFSTTWLLWVCLLVA